MTGGLLRRLDDWLDGVSERGGRTGRAARLTRRVARRMHEDRGLLVAAGLAFYAGMSLVPAMVAVASIYVLVTGIPTVIRHIERLTFEAPDEVQRLLVGQLLEVADQADGAIVAWFAGGLVLWFWGASRATHALIRALNLVYGVTDEDDPGRHRIQAVVVTVAIVVVVALALGATEMAAEATGASGLWPAVLRWGRWPVLLALAIVALGFAYRFAPDDDGERSLASPGTVVAAAIWTLASAGLAVYLTVVGFTSAFYGALGAVLALQFWAFVLSAAVLVGAYVDAELDGPRAAPE